ncbi:MAG: twin-arginine translocation pathway signal protein [Betaproteobacteria bacterium]|nr:MAG: twin-arginine translocation pathway signal protein [Betaproteobacteria bacterium]
MSNDSKHNPNRRRAIGLIGGGMVLATTGLAGCSSTYPEAAVRAWIAPVEQTDVRRFMLAHALLAPNPHNRQPWLADLRRNDEITLVCDKDRLLPETDPFGRQILIGCGAFIELAVIAAAELGYRVRVDTFPQGEPAANELPGGAVVAKLFLTADASLARDPLFAQIRLRRTNKNAYDNARRLPDALWPQLASSAGAFGLLTGEVSDSDRIERIRLLTRASFATEMTTPRTWLESANLLRIGPAEIEKHRDGISVMGAVPRLMTSFGMFDRFEVPTPGSTGYSQVMERWMPFETGSGYFWIASKGNSRRSQVESGRAYVRAHLQATANGVEMHPLSQALQEFAEVRAQYDALYPLIKLDPAQTTIQMLARVGYAKVAAPPTPRRDLAQMVTA